MTGRYAASTDTRERLTALWDRLVDDYGAVVNRLPLERLTERECRVHCEIAERRIRVLLEGEESGCWWRGWKLGRKPA